MIPFNEEQQRTFVGRVCSLASAKGWEPLFGECSELRLNKSDVACDVEETHEPGIFAMLSAQFQIRSVQAMVQRHHLKRQR